jgi:PAS domain S-box-containing protein
MPLAHSDAPTTTAATVPRVPHKSRSGAAAAFALPTAVVAVGLGGLAWIQDGFDSPTALSLLAIGVWALAMFLDRSGFLRLAALLTAAAGILHATRSFGATDQALAGLLATACMVAAAGAWARARHATSGVCQVTLMLAAAASGYLGILGVMFPDARMQDSTSVLAVALPIGMSWLMLHRMDWSRPASIGVLAAAASLGTIAAAILGLLFGAPFLAGFEASQVPMTASGSVCMLALAAALLAVEFDNRRLVLALVVVPTVLALYSLAARGVGGFVPTVPGTAPLEHWLRSIITTPGAITLLVCSIALGLGAMLRRYRSGATLLWIGGLAAVLVSTIALVALLAGIPREVAGAARSGSIPTVVGLWLLGIGMMSSRPVRVVDPAARQRWLPVWIGALVCVCAAWLSNAQYQQDLTERQRGSIAAGNATEAALRSALAEATITAERIAQRLVAIDASQREAAFSTKTMRALSTGNALDSVDWLDASLAPRAAAIPRTPASNLPGPGSHRWVADAAQELLGRGDIRSLWVGPLAGADDGLLRVVLVYALRFEGGSTDFLLLSFDLETMLDDALRASAIDHDLEIAFDGVPGRTFRRGATSGTVAWETRPEVTINIDRLRWTLRVSPLGGALPKSPLPALVLWSGVLISALLAVMTRLALIGRQRAVAAETANAALRRAASWDRAQRDTLVAVATDRSFDEVLVLVVRTFEARFPGVRCGILVIPEPGAAISAVIAPSLPAAWRAYWLGRTPTEQSGAGGTCIHRNRTVTTGDVEFDTFWQGHRAVARSARIRSAWATPIKDAQGRTLGSFEVYRDDVRGPDAEERDALESIAALAGVAFDREAVRTRVEVSRQWFVSLFERSPNAVMAYGLDGKLVDCNEHTAKRAGVPREALKGTSVEFVVLPEHREQVRKRFALAAGGEAQSFETAVQIPTGPREVIATLIPIAVGGDIVGVFVIVNDVTERNRIQRELQTALVDVSQRNRELQDFAFVATHDLQEPLRKIQAFSDRVLQRFGSVIPAPGVDYLQRIDASAHRMQVLIDDLLAYSRVATSEQEFSDVATGMVAREVLADLELRIEECAATIDLGPLPDVHGDHTQIRQLLQNLLSNALKFRAPDRPSRIRIEGRVDPEHPHWVRLVVEDNGIGFEPEHAQRIFVPFQRLHSKEAYGGTGIGLAVVRRIVERHRGSVRAIGSPGQGARFEIELPLAHGAMRALAVDDAALPGLAG